jgi:hypothetical protein
MINTEDKIKLSKDNSFKKEIIPEKGYWKSRVESCENKANIEDGNEWLDKIFYMPTIGEPYMLFGKTAGRGKNCYTYCYNISGLKQAILSYIQSNYILKSDVENNMLEKILYIGEEIPETLVDDPRPKFILLGTPHEFIHNLKEGGK